MSYTNITTDERESIQMMLARGENSISVAGKLNRSKSTISRELIRNSLNGIYSTLKAEKLSKERKKHCGATNKLSNNHILKESIHAKLIE
ncbi:MAG: helix-turn-helix domain-containing protein [Fusobacteria bacterium]|nr:helix-turn-helix domain-containing protein [Fusobacteriota bacterium]